MCTCYILFVNLRALWIIRCSTEVCLEQCNLKNGGFSVKQSWSVSQLLVQEVKVSIPEELQITGPVEIMHFRYNQFGKEGYQNIPLFISLSAISN